MTRKSRIEWIWCGTPPRGFSSAHTDYYTQTHHMSVKQHIPGERVWLTRAVQMADAPRRGALQCPDQIIPTERS
jgi:hypothetical protein